MREKEDGKCEIIVQFMLSVLRLLLVKLSI